MMKTRFHLMLVGLVGLLASVVVQAEEIDFVNNSGGTQLINQSIPAFAVLKDFNFRFSNEGHKIKSIGLLRAGDLTHVNFQDNDGNDPYTIDATYHNAWRFRPIFGETISGSCRTQCTRTLRNMTGHIPVLQGFSLRFTDGGDHQITEMRVAATPIAAPQGQHRLRVILRERGDNRPFNFVVRLIWVPLGNIDDASWTISDRSFFISSPNRPIGVRGDAILKGFGCRYIHNGQDDAHYLRQVRFDPGPANLNRARIGFHDGDADDRRACFMTYATLR